MEELNDGSECLPMTMFSIEDNFTFQEDIRIGYLMLQFEEILDDLGLGETFKSWGDKERRSAKVATQMFFGVDLSRIKD